MAWRRLGAMLIQRRTAIDPRFHNRGTFCDVTGLHYRVVYDIEEAKRRNFGNATLAAIETAYQLEPGTIADFTGGEPAPAPAPLAAVPDIPAAGESMDETVRLDRFGREVEAIGDPLELKVWHDNAFSRAERALVIRSLRYRKNGLLAEHAGIEEDDGTALSAATS
jgi:hypothetical protein